MISRNTRRPSYRLTFDDAVEVWKLRWAGEIISRIAGRFDVNMARVHEVLSGTRHPGSEQVARGMSH